MINENKSLISGKKVLIVEDDIFINSLFAEKLFEMGAIVFSAKNEEEAFKILKVEKVDIISLDLLLPGTNGFDILKKIKIHSKSYVMKSYYIPFSKKSFFTNEQKLLIWNEIKKTTTNKKIMDKINSKY